MRSRIRTGNGQLESKQPESSQPATDMDLQGDGRSTREKPNTTDKAAPVSHLPVTTVQQLQADKSWTFEEAASEAAEFRDERNWAQFHNPKDLAISISLEASELLEIFQWSGVDLERSGRLDDMCDELADVLIYCTLLADRLGVNPGQIMHEKIQKNAEKYPVSKARGTSKKYTEL